MACNDIAYPYLEHSTGHHKHVGIVAEGTGCTTVLVRANMVEVPIETVPFVDDVGRGTPGITQFCREYPESAPLTVTLTAPSVWRGVVFQRWIINDVEQPESQMVVSFEVDTECIIAFAKYGSDIEPINCPGVTLPSHMLVSLTGSCGIIDTVPGFDGTGTACLPAVWRAHGLSVTVVNDGISPVWVGEEFFRTCPVNNAGDGSTLPCSNNDCSENTDPFGSPLPQCQPHVIPTVNLWATKQSASFGINCVCDAATGIVTVFYGIGFQKEGCSSLLYYLVGPIPGPDPNICGGGGPGWVCHVRQHIDFKPQYVIPEPLTTTFDGTQEDCDVRVQQLVRNADFETTFTLRAHVGPTFPPPLVQEMRCTGIIRVR